MKCVAAQPQFSPSEILFMNNARQPSAPKLMKSAKLSPPASRKVMEKTIKAWLNSLRESESPKFFKTAGEEMSTTIHLRFYHYSPHPRTLLVLRPLVCQPHQHLLPFHQATEPRPLNIPTPPHLKTNNLSTPRCFFLVTPQSTS